MFDSIANNQQTVTRQKPTPSGFLTPSIFTKIQNVSSSLVRSAFSYANGNRTVLPTVNSTAIDSANSKHSSNITPFKLSFANVPRNNIAGDHSSSHNSTVAPSQHSSVRSQSAQDGVIRPHIPPIPSDLVARGRNDIHVDHSSKRSDKTPIRVETITHFADGTVLAQNDPLSNNFDHNNDSSDDDQLDQTDHFQRQLRQHQSNITALSDRIIARKRASQPPIRNAGFITRSQDGVHQLRTTYEGGDQHLRDNDSDDDDMYRSFRPHHQRYNKKTDPFLDHSITNNQSEGHLFTTGQNLDERRNSPSLSHHSHSQHRNDIPSYSKRRLVYQPSGNARGTHYHHTGNNNNNGKPHYPTGNDYYHYNYNNDNNYSFQPNGGNNNNIPNPPNGHGFNGNPNGNGNNPNDNNHLPHMPIHAYPPLNVQNIHAGQFNLADYARRQAEKAAINARVNEQVKNVIKDVKNNFTSVFHGFPDTQTNIDATLQNVCSKAIAFIVDILLWYGQHVKPHQNIFNEDMAVSHIISQLKSQAKKLYTSDQTGAIAPITTVPQFVMYFLKYYVKQHNLPSLKQAVLSDMPSEIELKHSITKAFKCYQIVVGVYNEIIDLAWQQNFIMSVTDYNTLLATQDDVYLHIYSFLTDKGIIKQFRVLLTEQPEDIKQPRNLTNLEIAMGLYEKSLDATANMTSRIKALKIVTKQRTSCNDPTSTVAGRVAQANYNSRRNQFRNNRSRGNNNFRRFRSRYRGNRSKRSYNNNNFKNYNRQISNKQYNVPPYGTSDNYTNNKKYNRFKNRPNQNRGRGTSNRSDNKITQSYRGGYKSYRKPRYNKHNNNNRTSYNRNNGNKSRGKGRGQGRRQSWKTVPIKSSPQHNNSPLYRDATDNPSVNVNNLPTRRNNSHQTRKHQNGHRNKNKRPNVNCSNTQNNSQHKAQYFSVQVFNSDLESNHASDSIGSYEYESPPPAANIHAATLDSRH